MAPAEEDRSRSPDPPDDDPRAEALGRAIKVIRTGLGLGRMELAERAGLSYSYLAEIENGKKQASSSAQHAIATALGMSASELLAAAEEWAVRLAGDEVGATPLATLVNADPPPSFPGRRSQVRDADTPLGARERALRWFRDSTATRVWDRSEIEASSSDSPRRRSSGRRSSGDDDLDGTLAHLRELLRSMSHEDRERVLDLARRLATG